MGVIVGFMIMIVNVLNVLKDMELVAMILLLLPVKGIIERKKLMIAHVSIFILKIPYQNTVNPVNTLANLVPLKLPA